MSQPISLYDTLRRGVYPLESLEPGVVRMYTCGPTVYNDQHIGNYRTFIFEDVLVHTLEAFGYQVDRVMNITDVGHLTSDADDGEDKLEVGARREGITAWEVARRYEARFLNDLKQFNISVPARLVRATDTIVAQIALIQELELKGMTYRTEDGIYFDSTRFPKYGALARLNLEGQEAGARVDMGEKRHGSDFALWKFSPASTVRDMEWESPWGKGFPGWHIECSAIALQDLGPELDIHCGGVDHIPVHHTNEIAQSEAVTGKQLARHWCHADFLLVDGGKMSKSLGNVYTVADFESRGIDPLAFRLFTYSATYRSKLNFTWDGMDVAHANLKRLRHLAKHGAEGVGDIGALRKAFTTSLADDLNTPQALAVLWEVVRLAPEVAGRQELITHIDSIFQLNLLREEVVPAEVTAKVEEREMARQSKNWELSDQLRQEIIEMGYSVLDTAEGPIVEKVL